MIYIIIFSLFSLGYGIYWLISNYKNDLQNLINPKPFPPLNDLLKSQNKQTYHAKKLAMETLDYPILKLLFNQVEGLVYIKLTEMPVALFFDNYENMDAFSKKFNKGIIQQSNESEINNEAIYFTISEDFIANLFAEGKLQKNNDLLKISSKNLRQEIANLPDDENEGLGIIAQLKNSQLLQKSI